MKIVYVGLIGLGVVGSGAARILIDSRQALLDKTGIDFRIKKIATLPPINPFKINLPDGIIARDADEIINDPDISVVIETVGGIEPAKTIMLKALAAGKDVISANKKLLSEHGAELFKAALANNVAIGYEASCGGGIPCILALRDGLVANRIDSLYGIVNGTSNYILTRMVADGLSFADALREAQGRGYAEADPTLDVGGGDSAHKLSLLGSLAFHQLLDPKQIPVSGIDGIDIRDIRNAKELGYEVKLLAVGKRTENGLDLRVHPALLPAAHPLAAVSGVFNAIYVVGDAVGEEMFYGKGAGQMPTGSAIIADLVASARGEARQSFQCLSFLRNESPIPLLPSGESRCSYYLRLTVKDTWGVVGQIGSILGEHRVSVRSLIQHDSEMSAGATEPSATIIILTHSAKERRVMKALDLLEQLPVVMSKPVFIRVEGE